MITSASNTRVKKVAALNQKAKERRQEGKYVVEGVKMFLEAQEEEIEELKFFNIAEVELDNISPPIRPVVKRFIEQNS